MTDLEQSSLEIETLRKELPTVEANVKLEKSKCATLEQECAEIQKANEEMKATEDEIASLREKVYEFILSIQGAKRKEKELVLKYSNVSIWCTGARDDSEE